MKEIKNNPFLRLVGLWKTRGKVLRSENTAEAELNGMDSYEIILNGHYLLHKADVLMGSEKSETFELIAIAGKESAVRMDYYNSNGDSGSMTGAINNNDFTIDSGNLMFRGKLADDDTLITGKWRMRSEAGEWKDYIELELKKTF